MSKSNFSLDKFEPSASNVIKQAVIMVSNRRKETVSLWNLFLAMINADPSTDEFVLDQNYMEDIPWSEAVAMVDSGQIDEASSPLVAMIKSGLDIKSFYNSLQNRLNMQPDAQLGERASLESKIADFAKLAQDRSGAGLITLRSMWIEMIRNPEISQELSKHNFNVASQRQMMEFFGIDPHNIDVNSNLGKFCVDLTKLAEDGDLDPVVGRGWEIRESMNILQQRSKNNPIFVGEPGVGKTALVNGLAQRMVNNEVPEALKDKRLLSLDIVSLSSGAKSRGEIEERVKGLIKEIEEREDIVLFIDDIHNITNASSDFSGVGNILKSALAKGELRCIGATTPDEYRAWERDPSLERRFQKINVNEPEMEEAVTILRGLKEKFAIHHGVEITDNALVEAVKLASRYITDRHLPDTAIDLIDAATARVRVTLDSDPEELDKENRRHQQLKMERFAIMSADIDDDTQKRLEKIEEDILESESNLVDLQKRLDREKILHDNVTKIREEIARRKIDLEKAKRESDITLMAKLQYETLPELEESLKDARKSIQEIDNPLLKDQVTANEVAEIVSRRTGIPLSKMHGDEQEKLVNMEQILGSKVIGQPEAVEAVSDAIRRARSGLSDPGKPLGSFLFPGTTGVGKTELTKVLSEFLFDRKDAMVRIDMSEFMEKHSVSRLIGAPPGYVGYEEGGVLTEAIRNSPYSVILLDEVEKAHPDVFNILLQVLDDGHLTDSQGRVVDFKNTVIVMTSNAGARDIKDLSSKGAPSELIKEAVMESLHEFFRPEFLNRLDEVVVFKPLGQEEIYEISKLQIRSLKKRTDDRKIDLVVDDSALRLLSEWGFDPDMGARPLKRAIQQHIENPLSKKMLSGQVKQGDRLTISEKDGQLDWVVSSMQLVNDENKDAINDQDNVLEVSASQIAKKKTEKKKNAVKKESGVKNNKISV